MPLSETARRKRHIEAAQGYLMLDMPDHALRELRQAKEPDPRDPLAFIFYYLKAEAYREKKEYEEALKAFEQAEAIQPNELNVGLGKAWCYKRIGQLQAAIATMEHLCKLYPTEPIVLYNLACYFALAGLREEALSWLGRALRLDSSLRKLIPDEHDFDSLRDDPEFRMIAGVDSDSQSDQAGIDEF